MPDTDNKKWELAASSVGRERVGVDVQCAEQKTARIFATISISAAFMVAATLQLFLQ